MTGSALKVLFVLPSKLNISASSCAYIDNSNTFLLYLRRASCCSASCKFFWLNRSYYIYRELYNVVLVWYLFEGLHRCRTILAIINQLNNINKDITKIMEDDLVMNRLPLPKYYDGTEWNTVLKPTRKCIPKYLHDDLPALKHIYIKEKFK